MLCLKLIIKKEVPLKYEKNLELATMKNIKLIITLLSVLLSLKATSQVVYENQDKGQKLQIIHKFQFWSVYQEIDIDRMAAGADNRLDFNIRRGRFGTKGSINKNIDFQVWYAYDLLGRDYNTNFIKDMLGKNDDKAFQPWDAFVKLKLDPKFNITTGFFRPQTSRESIRSAFGTMTFEKVFSNFVHRSYTLGKGHGRAPGINLSGNFETGEKQKTTGIKYDLGIFNAFQNNFVASPMYAGRLTFYLGEFENNLKDNHFGNKNGIILGIYSTLQPKVQQTALENILKFSNAINSTEINPYNKNNAVLSTSYGVDFLLNFNGFNLKAEYTTAQYAGLMGTENTAIGDYSIVSYDAIAGYTINKIGNGALEFIIAYSVVDADDKINLGNLSIVDLKYGDIYGDVNLLDIGLNYYLDNEKYKINLHYVIVNENTTININDYKNNFIGLGLQYQW